MINADQLFKAGRTQKIFEVVDRLQVNNFYNITGYTHSSIHGKMSRLKLVIVDITGGKKDKAKVGEFNLTANEWRANFKFLQSPEGFMNRFKKGLQIAKANPYKKNGKFIEVKKLSITFEHGLRVPKWKFEILTGQAIPAEDGFGYDSKTFKETSGKINFLLDKVEVEEMYSYITRYLDNWEKAIFPEFLKYRDSFKRRAFENNYNEDTIKDWNNSPYELNRNNTISSATSSTKSVATSNAPNNSKKVSQEQFLCSDCKKPMKKDTYTKTVKLFGKGLCEICMTK